MVQRWCALSNKAWKSPKLRALIADRRGTAAVELAMTLPILTLLSIGAFDISRMIATRIDYQQAAAEVASLAVARPPQGDTTYLKNAAASASGLDASKITVTTKLECNGTTSNSECSSGQEQARFVTMTFNGQYTPVWTHFGVENTVNMTVSKTIRYQ